MSFDTARNAYQEVGAQSADQVQLVVMLYDGAIRFLGDAKTSIQQRNLPAKTIAVDRTLAIIGELQSTLKLDEGGEIAASLDKLYTYMTSQILEASLRLEAKPLDEVARLLGILNSAWMGIASGPARTPNAPEMPLDPGDGARPLEVFG